MRTRPLFFACGIALGCGLVSLHVAAADDALVAPAPTAAAAATPLPPTAAEAPAAVSSTAAPQAVETEPPLEAAEPHTAAPNALDEASRAQARALAAEQGRPLYMKFCATCHGRDGDGHGPSASALQGRPLDFTRGVYKFRTTPAGMIPTQPDIERTIRLGLVGTQMPAWRKILSPADISRLARYLMALSPRFWTAEPPPPVLEIPPEPAADAASIARGQAIFARTGCPVCHGAEGHGDGLVAASLVDDWGKPVRPLNFHSLSPKGGSCAACYYRTISTGHTGTPMPSFVTLLQPAERWDVVHYVMSLREPRGVLDYLLDPAGRMTTP